jgi:hypothetical protein
MTPLDVASRRLRNERLVGRPFAEPADAVKWLGAVQSQDYAGAKWAVAQRVRACSDADVERACDRGDIVRTHVLRPTWHFVAPADVRWMLALTAPRIHAASAYYVRQLGLDLRTFERSNAVLAASLRGNRHLTRDELGEDLRRAGIRAEGPRLAYLMMRAELDALICSGPRRGKQFTYALLDERVPPTKTLARDEALAELARRYFASHGPATLQDFAWWSGLTVADGTRAVELAKGPIVREIADGKTYWLVPSRKAPAPKKPTVHLLPNYDELLVAYKDHAPSFDGDVLGALDKRGNVLSSHIVVKDGRVIGGWRRTLETGVRRRGRRPAPSNTVARRRGRTPAPSNRIVLIETRLLAELDEAAARELRAAAERYGRFLGLPVKLTTRPARRRARLRESRRRSA